MKEIKPQHGPIQENEILLKDQDAWLHFSYPYRVLSVNATEDVVPALQKIEQWVESDHWYAAGFISYEAAQAFDPALRTQMSACFPLLWFGLYPKPRKVMLTPPGRREEAIHWVPSVDRETYDTAFDQIKQYIAVGKTYQVNYTIRLLADFPGDPWNFFLHLAQTQNTHAAYINTGDFVVCSASPELFFQLENDTITCRPMKGTTRRGRTTAEDLVRAEGLRNSEKNHAENVMIVDMVRNDMGKIAETGTVQVPELFKTERYPTLWQMTSTVTAKTRASVTEILAALFPCASITGAPKVSTMQIISEVEKAPRGVYTGSIGYIAPERTARFNVAIRTAVIDRKTQTAEYGVGGGIVWDSTKRDEYAEALLKAGVLTEQPPAFSLIETMLWTPEEGFFLSEKHLARILDSADYFDIPVTREKLEKYFDTISSHFRSPQRVRVVLDQAGKLDFNALPLESKHNIEPLQICLARGPIDSNNVFLYHKTTQRTVYETAREGCEECDDVLLYNEMGELTEFTIGNLVVELEDQLMTPPISCGVLPGTFRAHLLETGQVVERAIPVVHLQDCTSIFRVNSVRKWQEAELQPELRKIS